LDYSVPVRPDLLPGSWWSFRPLPDTIFARYSRTNYFMSWFPEKKDQDMAVSTTTTNTANAIFNNARTLEYTDDWQGKMNFSPWTGFTLSPSYQQTKVTEERRFSEEDLVTVPGFSMAQNYNKSFSQKHGMAVSWRMLRWLEPRFTYEFSGTETNGLPTASSPTASTEKVLSRSASGDAFLNFTPRDLFPGVTMIHSLRFDGSFRVENQDTYEHVPEDYTDWQKVQPFRVGQVERRNGGSMFGLLSPLEFKDNPEVLLSQMTARNTLRVAGNWSPLDWLKTSPRWDPLKTLSVSNTLTNTNEHTENTLTRRDVHTMRWLDMITSLRDLEKTLGLTRWVGGSNLTGRANRQTTETFLEEWAVSRSLGGDFRFTLMKRLDWFFSMSRTDGKTNDIRTGLMKSENKGISQSVQMGTNLGVWRLTPSVAYRSDVSVSGTGVALQDLQTTNYSLVGRMDKGYPLGFRFPFTQKVFVGVNRLILDAKIGFEQRRSSINYTTDNTDTYSGEATGEWEIMKNFRLSFGGKTSLVNNTTFKENGFVRVELNSQLVIQF